MGKIDHLHIHSTRFNRGFSAQRSCLLGLPVRPSDTSLARGWGRLWNWRQRRYGSNFSCHPLEWSWALLPETQDAIDCSSIRRSARVQWNGRQERLFVPPEGGRVFCAWKSGYLSWAFSSNFSTYTLVIGLRLGLWMRIWPINFLCLMPICCQFWAPHTFS